MMIGKLRVPLRSVVAGAAGTAALTLAYRTEHLLRPAVQRPLDYDDSLVPGKIVANVLHLPSVTDREDAELGTALRWGYGSAFGIFHGSIGIAALPSSIVFGILWKVYGARTAFVAFLDGKPHLLRRLHEFAGHELSLAQEQMLLLGRRSADEKVALQTVLAKKPEKKSPLEAMAEALAGRTVVKEWKLDERAP